jgi:hypothetical protein
LYLAYVMTLCSFHIPYVCGALPLLLLLYLLSGICMG